jgi:hypothetical protein
VTQLCLAAGCRIRQRHHNDCNKPDCEGCIPRLAAPGLYLCDYHTTRIATDALRCAELYDELETVLASPETHGEHTTGTPEHGTAVNQAAVDARTEIRHTLAAYTRMVAEERGIHLPPDTVTAVGAYLATHHQWLAAHPTAADCSAELSELRRKAWKVAYPTGARVFAVGSCPQCNQPIRVVLRDSDSLLPSVLVCDGDHQWPADQWRQLRKRSDRYHSAREIAETHHLAMAEVYRLASEHRWRRTEDGRRPTLYLAEDVEASMTRSPA